MAQTILKLGWQPELTQSLVGDDIGIVVLNKETVATVSAGGGMARMRDDQSRRQRESGTRSPSLGRVGKGA